MSRIITVNRTHEGLTSCHKCCLGEVEIADIVACGRGRGCSGPCEGHTTQIAYLTQVGGINLATDYQTTQLPFLAFGEVCNGLGKGASLGAVEGKRHPRI